jgi:hypothetical protein
MGHNRTHAQQQKRLIISLDQLVGGDEQTPEAVGALVKADAEKWWSLIKELGIKAE